MIILKLLFATLLILITTSHLLAEVFYDGKKLHSENCEGCHAAMTGGDGSVLYTRKNRIVNSDTDLENRIEYCQSSLKLNWITDQTQSVKQFLNQSYYNFIK